jgi:hypothetical protein
MSLLPFDPTGVLATNKKVETHTITSINGVEYNYIVPDHAPFYLKSLVVVHVDTGQILTDSDYEPLFEFPAATTALKTQIFCGFCLTNPAANGTYQVQIQSIGGDYVTPATQAIENGLGALFVLRNSKWSNINPETIPATFPASAHSQPLTDVAVLAAMQNYFSDVTETLKNLPHKGIVTADIQDLDAEFLTPILSAMTEIAVAIKEREASVSQYHEADYLYNQEVDLGVVTTTAWKSISGLSVTIGKTGTYKVDWTSNPYVLPNDAHVVYRMVLNGNIYLTTATINGYIRSFTEGDVISLQVCAKNKSTTSVIVSDAVGKITTGITAILLSA